MCRAPGAADVSNSISQGGSVAPSEQTGPTTEERALPRLSRSPSTRVRILGWYVALLAFALVIGLLLQRSILLAQVDDEVDAQLRQEVGEMDRLSGGRNPSTGEPFGSDVRAIFDTFLSRNIPVQGEALFTLVDGRPHASTTPPPSCCRTRISSHGGRR